MGEWNKSLIKFQEENRNTFIGENYSFYLFWGVCAGGEGGYEEIKTGNIYFSDDLSKAWKQRRDIISKVCLEKYTSKGN